jgi:hypothetical protein
VQGRWEDFIIRLVQLLVQVKQQCYFITDLAAMPVQGLVYIVAQVVSIMAQG